MNLFTQAGIDLDRPASATAVAIERRDRAIERARSAAPAVFIIQARAVVCTLARSGRPFTTDDVWADLPGGATPPEPRAMGAVMRECQRGGLIVPLDLYRPSTRPECHRNPKRVWQGAGATELARAA